MYEYLTGIGIMFIVWVLFFVARKDLRKPMVWSGLFYIIILTIGFFALSFVSRDPARAITPGYWQPYTLFNLGQKTGGYAIEDILFMFFAGGIATALYEFFFHKRISTRIVGDFKRRYALLFGIFGILIFHYFFYLNDIYLLIVFNFFGTLAILYQRRDLFLHSILGGILFLCTYILGFLLLMQLYPNLISDIYRLQLTSGVMLFGIPLEEYLYAITFGMLWAPIYEYEHRYKDK